MITLVAVASQAARYRVNSNTTADIYDAENPGVELARKGPGFTFTAEEVVGTKIYFNYNGKRGYIKKYLCTEIPDAPVPSHSASESVAAETSTSTATAGTAIEPGQMSVTSVARAIFNVLCFVWFIAGIVMAIFLLIDRQHCIDRFNRWAGADVAKLISWKNFRPVFFLFFIGLGVNLGHEALGVALACVYELILLACRAHHFQSWRAAIIEALYLVLWTGGVIINISFAIILMIFAAQPAPNKWNSKVDECCDNCYHSSRNNGSTCRCHYHNMDVSLNSRCNKFSVRH